MRAFAGIALLAALAAGAVILSAPAALLERVLPEDQPVRLRACSGWLWQSGACLVVVRTHSGWISAGAISYAWRAGPVLELAHDGRPAGSIRFSHVGWTAKGINARLSQRPLDALPRQFVAALHPAAEIIFGAPSLSCGWRGFDCTGQGRLEVNGLVMGAARNDPVGSYLLEIEMQGGQAMGGRLSTLSGPLAIDGKIERGQGGPLRLIGRATPGSGVAEDIRLFIAAFARHEGGGAFAFSYPP